MTIFRLYEHGREVEDALLFWLTEYLRRNIELQIMRNKLLVEHSKTWKDDEDAGAHIFFEEGYPPLFSKPEKGFIDTTIHQLSSGKFSPKVDPEIFADGGAVTFEISMNSERKKEILARIDPCAPKDIIINDICLFFDHYRREKVLTVTSEYVIDDDGNPVGTVGDAETLTPGRVIVISSTTLSHIKGMRYNKSSDAARAIGLWLYDYIEEMGVTQSKAIKALEESGHLLRLGLAPATEDLRFYLRRTKDCIKAKKLLPFTKKGTQKRKLVPGTENII